MKRSEIRIAHQKGRVCQRDARVTQILRGQSAPRFIDEIAELAPLVGQPTLQCAWRHGHTTGHVLNGRFAIVQTCGDEPPRTARKGCRVAKSGKAFFGIPGEYLAKPGVGGAHWRSRKDTGKRIPL